MRTFRTLFSSLSLLFLAASAQALTYHLPTGCGSCEGVTGSLAIIDDGGSFSVTLTLNTDSYTGTRTGFNQVGFGAIKNWTSVTLVSDPTSSSTPWASPVEANTSSNALCTNGTSSDKVCTHGFVDVQGGGNYVWKFQVIGGTLKTGPDDSWHIGAQFADRAGTARGKIISEAGSATSPPVPEPSAALIFSACVILISRNTRRR